MIRALTIRRAGPGSSVQDQGRPGFLAQGLSRGGAVDPIALAEGAALLGQSPKLAAIEMAGMGGEYQAQCDLRIALTGAEMRASLDGVALAWNASHMMPEGSVLTIGAVQTGIYGYLHVGGGLDVPIRLGARAAHLAAGLGTALRDGSVLPVGKDDGGQVGQGLPAVSRFGGGEVRVLSSLQTGLFPSEVLERFQRTTFSRDHRGNRMGVRLDSDQSFGIEGGLTVLSEVIVPGDIQITGDGTPFVLLAECQTTGGYPRIGTVVPCDLPKVVQALPGAGLRFRFVDMEEALVAQARAQTELEGLRRAVRPMIRDPHDIADLLSYQLISGAIAGNEE